MNFVAIDIGASGGKIFLARHDANQPGAGIHLEEVHRFDNRPCRMRGALYWDFVGIFANVAEGIRKAVHITGDAVHSVGVDSFSNDFGIVDSSGALVTPVRCYRDARTSRLAAALDTPLSPADRYRLSGNQNARFNTLMHLAAMLEDGQAGLLENGATLLLIPDLLNYMMTGRKCAEYTIASVSQMFSFKDGGWCREILDAYGIPPGILPSIVMPGSYVGPSADDFNQEVDSRGFNVAAVCGHDTASAFLSAFSPDDSLIISCGTWALVGVETSGPIINHDACRLNFANEGGYPGHHRFLRNAMGSWVIQELRRELERRGERYSFTELDALAAQAKPFAHAIDVDDERFFSPGDLFEKVRAVCRENGASAPESVGACVRAIQESLAFRYRWIMERIQELTGKTLRSVQMLGGGSKGDLACSFTASACRMPVFAGPVEASAWGNIAAQMLAAGVARNLGDAKKTLSAGFRLRTFQPENVDAWDKAYGKWKAKYAVE